MSYTFDEHARRCYSAAKTGQVLRQYLQVKVGREVACARLVDLWTTPDGSKDLWRVELQAPFKGLFYVTQQRVMQCSGLDGLCQCAGELEPSAATEPADAERAELGAAEGPKGRDVLVTRHFGANGCTQSHA